MCVAARLFTADIVLSTGAIGVIAICIAMCEDTENYLAWAGAQEQARVQAWAQEQTQVQPRTILCTRP